MIDWKNYKDEFPDRYIKYGYFDHVLESFIRQYDGKLVAVDIGGGEGTNALKMFGIETWLLDPNINKSYWIEDNISWKEFVKSKPGRFDIAVLRGSINYLTQEQIQSIPNICRGIMANSFERPEPGYKARRYKSKAGGGIEISNCPNLAEDKIQHILVNDFMEVIAHDFYAYGSDYFKRFISDVSIEKYNVNSLLLTSGICKK